MTGPEHYLEAEDLLKEVDGLGNDTANHLALAQVHATLALAAATAYPATRDYWDDYTSQVWAEVTAGQRSSD